MLLFADAEGAGISTLIGDYAGIAIGITDSFKAYRFVMLWVTGALARATGVARV